MSESSGSTREWKVLDTFGPVFSHGGFENWHLCVSRDGIVAVPVGFWPTFWAGLGAGMGSFWVMQKAYARPSDVDGERVLVDDGKPAWRRYPIEQIDRVYMKWCLVGANEIHLQLKGQSNHLYGLGDRGQTKACREKLKQLFSEVYSEKGFEKVT